jgi:hypothetical protein
VAFDIHPAETGRAEVTRQAAARFARERVNKADEPREKKPRN